jgi:hypothetical protein
LGVAFEAFGGLLLGCGLATVASLASVSVGHPDGFDCLAVGHSDEVAFGSVYGTSGLEDLGQTDGVAFGGEGVAEGLGEGGDLVERGDSLAIKGFVELGGAVGFLAKAGHEAGQFGQSEAEEGFFFNLWFLMMLQDAHNNKLIK